MVSGEAGRQGDTFIIRGYTAQNDVFRDGMRDLGWFTRDTFNIQNVEVYFGPSAVLFGRGSTGGAVNLVSKKPYDTTAGSVSLQGGTSPSGRVEGDVNVALSETFQFRLQAMGQLAKITDRDEAAANRAGFAPSFRVRLGEKTTLDFDYLYQHESNTPDYGQNYFTPAAGQDAYPVSFNLGVRRQVWYGVTGDNLPDYENVNANIATLRLQQGFGDASTLTVGVRYGQVHRLSRPTAPRNLRPPLPSTSPTTTDRQRYEIRTDNDYLAVQADFRTQFKTGPLEHTLTSGIELSLEKRSQYRRNSTLPSPADGRILFATPTNMRADLFDPDPLPDLSQLSWGYLSNNDRPRRWAASTSPTRSHLPLGRGPRVDSLRRLRQRLRQHRALNPPPPIGRDLNQTTTTDQRHRTTWSTGGGGRRPSGEGGQPHGCTTSNPSAEWAPSPTELPPSTPSRTPSPRWGPRWTWPTTA